ncbi:unnamed protein product [marine sediment metagenome]|uniref:Uncharacterized protein n=1 Tax=marine sediment metagenome TaxID=412755 RepID=X0RXE1_9ZZZZ
MSDGLNEIFKNEIDLDRENCQTTKFYKTKIDEIATKYFDESGNWAAASGLRTALLQTINGYHTIE